MHSTYIHMYDDSFVLADDDRLISNLIIPIYFQPSMSLDMTLHVVTHLLSYDFAKCKTDQMKIIV